MPETSSPTRKLSELFEHDAAPWRYRNDHLLEHLIRTQLHAARRNITPKHFFRFRKDISGTTSVFRETSALKKVYDDPVPVYIHINHTKPTKPLTPAAAEDQVDHTPRIDFAECVRLGEIFGVKDPKLPFHFYLPGSNDVYQWNFSLYTIGDVTGAPNGYYEVLQRFVVWEGGAKLLRGDSTDPLRPLAVQPEDPEVEQPLWGM